MQINRTSAVRALAVLSVAFAAGHLVQTLSAEPKAEAAADAMSEAPHDIQLLVAGADVSATRPDAPLVILANATTLVTPPVAAPSQPTIQLADLSPPDAMLPAVAMPRPDTLPTAPLAAQPAAPECKLTLELSAEPGAMIGARLLAPCHPDQRIVLHHAGLVVTGQTTATGAMFLGLPALEAVAEVAVVFGNGDRVSAVVELADFAGLHRFGVQWQAGRDAFQLQAYEGGASFGDAGHVSAENPGSAPTGPDQTGDGYLSLLGDATTELPMLAEVYTFPRNPAPGAEVVIEAPVTAVTCGHEMIGETLSSRAGKVTVTELTLAMPECDAVGGFLVLKNLVPDMTLAAAD